MARCDDFLRLTERVALDPRAAADDNNTVTTATASRRRGAALADDARVASLLTRATHALVG